MSRLIDADATLATLRLIDRKHADLDNGSKDFVYGVETAIEVIEDAPSIDLIPEFMKHYRQGLHDAELKRNGELMQSFDPD